MKASVTQLNSLVLLALISVLGAKPFSVEEPTDAEMPVQHTDSSITAVPRSVPAFHPRAVMIGNAGEYSPPDFSRYRDTRERKTAFFDYLLPMIYEANEEVMRERTWLIALAEQLVLGLPLQDFQRTELERVEKRYAIRKPAGSDANRVGKLLQRVDVVPASLVLAQAAKESGWGTSRFAREGNNFFGIWCFYRGCGLTPLHRAPGRDHEVATFDTVEEGVRYYIRTINTHVAYDELRLMRANARRNEEVAPGVQLANGLIRYSERGLPYVREIQGMIRYNQLSRFTRANSI